MKNIGKYDMILLINEEGGVWYGGNQKSNMPYMPKRNWGAGNHNLPRDVVPFTIKSVGKPAMDAVLKHVQNIEKNRKPLNSQ